MDVQGELMKIEFVEASVEFLREHPFNVDSLDVILFL